MTLTINIPPASDPKDPVQKVMSLLGFILRLASSSLGIAFLTIACCRSSTPTPVFVPQYSVIDLGTVGDAGDIDQFSYTSNWSLNSHGQAGGHVGDTAYLWSGGKRIALGLIGRLAVLDDGSVIGLYAPDHGHVGYHDYFHTIYDEVQWKNGITKNLGSAGVAIGSDMGILQNGTVIGLVLGKRYSYATIWKNGMRKDLGTLGSGFAVATAADSSGEVVGFSGFLHSAAQIGFVWKDNRMVALPTLSSFTDFAPTAISNAGYIAGWGFSPSVNASRFRGPDHALLWFHGGVTDLGTLGGEDSHAYAVNDSGEVVGRADTNSGQGAAFIYENGHMIDLNAVTPILYEPSPYKRYPIHLQTAVAINDRGQILVVTNEWDNVAQLCLLTPAR